MTYFIRLVTGQRSLPHHDHVPHDHGKVARASLVTEVRRRFEENATMAAPLPAHGVDRAWLDATLAATPFTMFVFYRGTW